MEEPEDKERKMRGRPRYPDKPMLNALMLIPFGIASEKELARRLETMHNSDHTKIYSKPKQTSFLFHDNLKYCGTLFT